MDAIFWYKVRLLNLFRPPNTTPKFKYIEDRFFDNKIEQAASDYGISLNIGCSSRHVRSLTWDDSDIVQTWNAVSLLMNHGKISVSDLGTVMNASFRRLNRADAHMSKRFAPEDQFGGKANCINIFRGDAAKKMETVLAEHYDHYYLGASRPIPSFHKCANVNSEDLGRFIYFNKVDEDFLILYEMKSPTYVDLDPNVKKDLEKIGSYVPVAKPNRGGRPKKLEVNKPLPSSFRLEEYDSCEAYGQEFQKDDLLPPTPRYIDSYRFPTAVYYAPKHKNSDPSYRGRSHL